ncbi:hypothetical protein KBZ13_03250 [Cyanobium sp. ATX 6F1]|nr:hypothetical protein [Cyanobium sp. ATX 6F1]
MALSPQATGERVAACGLSSERRELLCSVIGLSVKLGLSCVVVVSLFRIAGAYQERLDRNGELSAILDIENAKLTKAQERFDSLFATNGEQRLIGEQNQWIAPNRLRVVWQQLQRSPFPSVEHVPGQAGKATLRP